MRRFIALFLYRLILPLLFLAAFPSWLVKMKRRGGYGSGLLARISIYRDSAPCSGAIHLHAVSVGETLLALKLINAWRKINPRQTFVIATGTATGHAVAAAKKSPFLFVTYAPLDFKWMVRRYLSHFQPRQIVLIEGEVWPHILMICKNRGIPVRLVNARMSPRSARRFAKFAPWLRPFYGLLDLVAIQQGEDAAIWEKLGVHPTRIHHTGSLKFDPGNDTPPSPRAEFQALLDTFGKDRRVLLAVSTHAGEEVWLASALHEADPQALLVFAPRHAERRAQVTSDLKNANFPSVLRSTHSPDMRISDYRTCFIIDTTGELRDWTAHADVVIIGKSFLSTGGQNPCEAILAGKPVIFGPHMENFQPLSRQLLAVDACKMAHDSSSLIAAIHNTMNSSIASQLSHQARAQLDQHQDATLRMIDLLK